MTEKQEERLIEFGLMAFLVLCFFIAWYSSYQRSYPTLNTSSIDDVRMALGVIEAGQPIIGKFEISFPIYMNRFKIEVVNAKDYPFTNLPELHFSKISDKVVKITDSITDYSWIADGFSDYVRIN